MGLRTSPHWPWRVRRLLQTPGTERPYGQDEVERLDCFRCGSPAVHQWQVCADGNVWRPLCAACDVELNRRTLEWFGHPQAAQLMADYVTREGP